MKKKVAILFFHTWWQFLLTPYIHDDEFLILNQSYFTNIIILQAKLLIFIYLLIISIKIL